MLEKLIETLHDDHKLGLILLAQMGGTPEEVQMMVQIADYDEEKDAIKPDPKVYLLRCLGVQEHRLSLGFFNRMVLVEDHPLLWHHNFPFQQIYFRGEPTNIDELMLALSQLYGQLYGKFRNLADDLNLAVPLGTLLAGGYGLLGEMPLPLANTVKSLLEQYGLTVNFVESETDEPPGFKLLVMDDTYFIGQIFNAEPLQGRPS